MTDSLTIPSFAKVNLTLDVLSRRPDGFHNLASVFQAVSLVDTVTLTLRPQAGISLECDAPGVPADATNLAWRAAEAALRAAGRSVGIHIALAKRIPAQAGLGGGSSNAAAVLRGVNALCGLGLPPEKLSELAAGLGSDVPFFLVGGAASARGRGGTLTPLPDAPTLWLVIVRPDVGVSTAGAYAALDALPDRASARGTRRMEEAIRQGDVERILARLSNDFESVVYMDYLLVAALRDDLMMARAGRALLCGSGSAVFGAALDEAEAQAIARTLRLKYPMVHVCRTLTRSESLAMENVRE